MSGGLYVIIITMIVGGIIAYLGTQFGRQVGRRKISFLGLRPRYTSTLVTIIVGMFIAFFTITVIAFYSRKAKVALVGFQDLVKSKQKLQAEIINLNKKLGKSSAVFQVNEPISSGAISQGGFSDKERQMNRIIDDAKKEIKRRTAEKALFLKGTVSLNIKEKDLLNYNNKEYEKLLESLSANNSGSVVLVYSEYNAYFNQKVNVKFNVYPNVKLYNKGETLHSIHVKGNTEEEKLFYEMLDFLNDLEQKVIQKGMIRVPLSKSMIDLPISDVFNALSEIKDYGGWVEITANASEDLYTSGPLKFSITVNPL